MSKKLSGTTSKEWRHRFLRNQQWRWIESTFDRLWRFSCIYFFERTRMAMREMSF